MKPSRGAGSPRWSRRGGAADPHQRLADHVVEGESPESIAYPQSSEPSARRRGRARRGRWSRAAAISFGAAQRGHARRPGWRRACRASRRRARGLFIALARRCCSGWPVIASGSAITRLGRTIARTRCSAPAGRRWIPVISAPDSVVGIAATRGPAHRGDRLRGVDRAAAAEGDEVPGLCTAPSRAAASSGTCPAGTRCTSSAASPSCSAVAQGPAGRQQLERAEAVLGEQLGRLLDAAPPRKTTVRPASRQTNRPSSHHRRRSSGADAPRVD